MSNSVNIFLNYHEGVFYMSYLSLTVDRTAKWFELSDTVGWTQTTVLHRSVTIANGRAGRSQSVGFSVFICVKTKHWEWWIYTATGWWRVMEEERFEPMSRFSYPDGQWLDVVTRQVCIPNGSFLGGQWRCLTPLEHAIGVLLKYNVSKVLMIVKEWKFFVLDCLDPLSHRQCRWVWGF